MYLVLGLEKNLDSRSLSLIDTYNSISRSNTIFINSENNSLIIRLFKVTFIFIKLFLLKYNEITGILILFKSHLFYPFIFIVSKFIKKNIIIDYGYPFEDNSSYKNKLIKNIYKYIELSFLNSKNINLLLESKSQIIRLEKQFKLSNLYCHYMTKSKGFYTNSDYLNESDFDNFQEITNIIASNYILFRGRLNYESGILSIIDLFHEFAIKKNKLKLVIQGKGILERKVTKKLKIISNSNIIFINKFISNKNMEILMKNSIGILGQFHNYKNRLNYTIPNKYYESLKLHKFYITPNWEPLKKPYLEKTNLLFPTIDENYNLNKWLIDNSDFLINNKKMISKEIKNISNECITWHKLINKESLKKIMFNSK